MSVVTNVVISFPKLIKVRDHNVLKLQEEYVKKTLGIKNLKYMVATTHGDFLYAVAYIGTVSVELIADLKASRLHTSNTPESIFKKHFPNNI